MTTPLWAICLPNGTLCVNSQAQALVFDNPITAGRIMIEVGFEFEDSLHLEAVEVINVPSV